MRNKTLVLAGILIAVVSHSIVNGQTATAAKVLRWKMQKGQKFNVSVTQDMEQEQTFSGQQMGSSTGMKLKISWLVLDVDSEGAFTVQQTIDHIAVLAKANTPMGEMVFDSEAAEEPQGMAAMLAQQMQPMLALKGVSIIQRFSANGESLGSEFPEGQEPPTGMMGKMSPQNVSQAMSNATLPVPSEEIEAGQEWTDEAETEVPQMGTLSVSRKFSYAGEGEFNSKQVDVIEMTAKTEFGDGGPNAMGMKIDVKDQETEGKIYFDNVAGYLVGAKIVQKMTATIEAMGQTIDQIQTITSTTTITPA